MWTLKDFRRTSILFHGHCLITFIFSVALESKLMNAIPLTTETLVASITRLYETSFYDHFCSGYFASPKILFTAGICIRKIKKYMAKDRYQILVHLKWNTAQSILASFNITKMEEFYEYNAVKKVLPNNNLDLGLIMVSLQLSYNSADNSISN